MLPCAQCSCYLLNLNAIIVDFHTKEDISTLAAALKLRGLCWQRSHTLAYFFLILIWHDGFPNWAQLDIVQLDDKLSIEEPTL